MGDKSDQPAARLGDIAGNHGPWPPTPIIVGSGNVLINGLPAARQGDAALLHAIPNNPPHGRSIAEGSGSVLINGKPAARTTDAISCGGQILSGSGNVLIGDNPTLVQPVKVDIPKLEIPTIEFGKQNTKLAKVRTPVSSTPANSSSSSATTNTQANSSDANASQAKASEANSSDATNTSSLLQTNQQAAIDYWQAQKDQAENFPAYLAAHLMGLNAETGYSIAEGLVATYDLVTDPSALADALVGLKDSIVDTVTDPIGTYNDIKQAAEDFAELPLSEQGETLYQASLEILAGGASVKTGQAITEMAESVAKAKANSNTLIEAADTLDTPYTPNARAVEQGPKAGDTVFKRDHTDGDSQDPYTLLEDGKPMGAESGAMPESLSGMEDLPENHAELVADGWPDLNVEYREGRFAEDYKNFLSAEPELLPSGTTIYRVVDELNNDAGAYWSLELPTNKTEWRSDMAVKDSWNDNGYYLEEIVGDEGLKVWKGAAAGQPYKKHNDNRFYLSGGGEQLFVSPKTLATGTPKLTQWPEK